MDKRFIFHFQKLWKSILTFRVDIVIHYLEVDFTFGLPDYVRYIEEFLISRFVIKLLRFDSIHNLLQLWLGCKILFIISRTSLNRGLLNRGSTVQGVICFLTFSLFLLCRLLISASDILYVCCDDLEHIPHNTFPLVYYLWSLHLLL